MSTAKSRKAISLLNAVMNFKFLIEDSGHYQYSTAGRHKFDRYTGLVAVPVAAVRM